MRMGVGVGRGLVSAFAGPLQLAQGPAQGLDFPLFGFALPFELLQQLEHAFHIVQRLAQGIDDLVDLGNGPLKGRG